MRSNGRRGRNLRQQVYPLQHANNRVDSTESALLFFVSKHEDADNKETALFFSIDERVTLSYNGFKGKYKTFTNPKKGKVS